MLRLRTFGGLSLSRGTENLTGAVTQRRRLAILVLLAVAGDVGMSRDKLVAYLTHCGFTVTAIEGMAITGVKEVGEVSTEALVALSKKVYAQDTSAQGVFSIHPWPSRRSSARRSACR